MNTAPGRTDVDRPKHACCDTDCLQMIGKRAEWRMRPDGQRRNQIIHRQRGVQLADWQRHVGCRQSVRLDVGRATCMKRPYIVTSAYHGVPLHTLNSDCRSRCSIICDNISPPFAVPCLRPHSTRNCRWAADLARGREWTQKFWTEFKWILNCLIMYLQWRSNRVGRVGKVKGPHVWGPPSSREIFFCFNSVQV